MPSRRAWLGVSALIGVIGCAYPEASFVGDDASLGDSGDSALDSSLSEATSDSATDGDTGSIVDSGAPPSDTSVGFDAPTCAAPKMLCGTSCIDVSSDVSHCGACVTKCPPSSTCSDGVCNCVT